MPVLSEAIRQRIRDKFPNYPDKRAVTLPALHIVQDELRCVSTDAIREIAELLELHPAEVHDTMSFYDFFRDPEHKLGRTRLWVCRGLACALREGEEVLADFCHKLNVEPGGTSAGRSTASGRDDRSKRAWKWGSRGRPRCPTSRRPI